MVRSMVEPALFVVVITSPVPLLGALAVEKGIGAIVSKIVEPALFVVVITNGFPLDPGIVVTTVLPAELTVVLTIGAPGIPVLAAPRRLLMADSREATLPLYAEGTAERKAGGVAARSADWTMELMSPVTPAAEAALWIATPMGTAALVGMYREMSWLAAEENWAAFVLERCQSARQLALQRCGDVRGWCVLTLLNVRQRNSGGGEEYEGCN